MKMTKEQAIKTLESLLLNIAGEKDCEAIELAIAALQSDPNAPDWSQAPEWANYYHKDSNDHCWWYECEPEKTSNSYNPKIGHIKLAKASHPMAKVKNHIEKLFKRPDL